MQIKLKVFIFVFFCSFSLFADSDLSVLIIGGGPTGLAAAIEARSQGYNVTIVEKREQYSRFQGLFLYDYSLGLLKKWEVIIPELKVYDLPKGHVEGSQMGIVTIRYLEEQLEKKALEMGVQKVIGKFESFGSKQIALINTFNNEELQVPYDVVIAADGVHSHVREALSIKKNFLGSAVGVWSIIPNIMEESELNLPPVIKQDNECITIISIPLIGEIILAQSFTEGSKAQIKRFLLSQGMTKEVRLIDKGYATFFENIPISLDQAQTFIDEEKSAILVGDSAATGSFLRGRGLNTSFKEAEIAGDFLKELRLNRGAAFQKFNQSMKETTDALIEDSAFLFGW